MPPSGWAAGTINRRSVFDFEPGELAALLEGEPAYRARQVLRWAFRGAAGYGAMSDLPAGLRARLPDLAPLWTLEPVDRRGSLGGDTQKAVFRLPDNALVETVRMEHPGPLSNSPPQGGRGTHARTTICVSSQAGCAYGCRFCATGQQGYGRDLSPGEMAQQVAWWLRAEEGGLKPALRTVTNVVFMGMGEPFANYDATMSAVRALNASWGLGLGARHITVSTVGLVPEIGRFAGEPLQANLAVSLHAANDGLRSQLMPVNRKYPLRELMIACKDYVARTNRRITFEYVLLGDVNDSPEQADELGRLLKGLLSHVNVIPVNPTGAGEFARPDAARIRVFVETAGRYGVPVTLRDTQGVDIQAGCGQLRARSPVPAHN